MKTIKKKLKAIIFDMDGTIVKTEDAWQKATAQYLVNRGVDMSLEENRAVLLTLSGSGIEACADKMRRAFKLKDSIEKIVKGKQKLVLELFNEELSFIEGFEDFHKEVRKHKIPSSIATNADDVSLKHIKESLDLHKMFGDHIYNISCVGYKAKPDPAIFLHAASMLGVEPSECLVFEDSLPGMTAAKSAGMKCIAIKNDLNNEHMHLADDCVDHYHDALDAMKRIL